MFHINGGIDHIASFCECNQSEVFLILQYLFLLEVSKAFNKRYLIFQIQLMRHQL